MKNHTILSPKQKAKKRMVVDFIFRPGHLKIIDDSG